MNPAGEEVRVMRVPVSEVTYMRLLAAADAVRLSTAELVERSVLGTLDRLESINPETLKRSVL